MMSDAPLFISYSRKDLYFAEALVLRLQEAGLKIWFDLQQLEPGAPWEDEIAEGLAASSGVVVVLSRGARTSPWVAKEWQHATDAGKSLYVLFFEAVEIDVIEHTFDDGNMFTTDLNMLLSNATAIIDARADFNNSVSDLVAAINGSPVKQPVPTVNRLNIPTRMPRAIWAVSGALALLMALSGAAAITAISIDILLFLGWTTITCWLALRIWSFIQRDDYRQARIALIIGVGFATVFALWCAVPLAVGALLALHSQDIHRYSPLTQGLRQRVSHIESSTRRKGVAGWWNRLAVSYGRLPGWISETAAGISLIMAAMLFFATLTSNPFSLRLLAYLFAGYVLTHIVLIRRYKWLKKNGLGRGTETGLTYTVIFDALDVEVAKHIEAAMNNAGHTLDSSYQDGTLVRQSTEMDAADIMIVVLGNNLNPDQLGGLADSDQRSIFVLASSLVEPDKFSAFARYQWVDFRRQPPGVLDAMAEDVLIFGSDIVSHSFGTRLTPQSFEKTILPRRVNLYILIQFFVISFQSHYITRLIVLTNAVGDVFVTFIAPAIASTVIAVWATNRVIRREITANRLAQLNIGVHTASLAYFFVVSAWQNNQSIATLDIGSVVLPILCLGIIWLGIAYYVERGILTTWLGGWIPNDMPGRVPFLAFRRDWRLWGHYAIVMGVVIIFTMMFFGTTYNPYMEQPMAQLLSQGTSPIGRYVALLLRGF